MDKQAIAFLLLGIAVVIAAARIGGRIARMFRQPPVIGEIAAGIALGPSLLGLMPGTIDEWLFPTDVRPLLGALAQVGLVLFMFFVGLELDVRLIQGRGRAAASVSALSIAVPFALGIVLALYLYPSHDTVDGEQIGKLGMVLFLGIAMSITAFPVLARILTDRGMQRTAPGVFSLAAAAIDDIIAWTLLAFVIAIISGGSPLAVGKIVALTLVYAAVMFLVVKPLLAKLLDWRARAGRLTPDMLAVILIGLFLSAAATDVIGIHQIFGAFLFGAIMPKMGGERLMRDLIDGLEGATTTLLLPMFFVVTGLAVNLSTIGGTGWWQLLLVLLVAISGKFIGAYTGARLSRLPSRQAGAIAVLMNTRGLTELVILTAGRELGVLSDELFAMMVVMALVTTVLTEPLLRVVYPESVVAQDIAAAERRAFAAGQAPRIVVLVEDPTASVAELTQRHRRLLSATAGFDVTLVALLAPQQQSTPDFAALAGAVETLTALGETLTEAGTVSVVCRFGGAESPNTNTPNTNTPDAAPSRDAQSGSRLSIADELDGICREVGAVALFVDADVDAERRGATGLRLLAAPVVAIDETAPFAAGDLTCLAPDTRSGRSTMVLATGLAVARTRRLTVISSWSARRVNVALAAVLGRGLVINVVDSRTASQSAAWLVRPEGVLAVAHDADYGGARPEYVIYDRTETSEESVEDRVTRSFALPDPQEISSRHTAGDEVLPA